MICEKCGKQMDLWYWFALRRRCKKCAKKVFITKLERQAKVRGE